jgi:GH24 family phage-related lysozyme (muramidase)|tara:strand:- start:10629 stop:13163 length:2535 start_codon:yes stop_codon:yes gene_type:complete
MATLNPTINSNIGFEQPVSTPSVVGGVAQLASGFLAAQPKPRQPSESDRQAVALRPFAERLDELRDSNLTDQQFLQAARKLTRNAIVNYPQYESEITGIGENYGVTAPSDIFSPQDTLVDNVSTWTQNTTEGQLAVIESQVVDASGQVDMELTLQNLTVAYQEDLANKAQIEQSNRDMQLVENDLKTWKAQSDTKIGSVFLPNWTKKTTKQVNALVSMAVSGDPSVDTVEEQLTFLRRQRTTLYNTYVGEAQAAGLHQSVYSGSGETNITSALKPIDNLIAQVEGQAKDVGTLLTSYRNAQEANALEQAVEVYGSVGVLPEFQRQVFSIAAGVFSEETATFLKGLKGQEAVGGLRLFEDQSPVADQNTEDRIRLGVADGQMTVEDIVSTAGKAISNAEMSDHSSSAKLLQQQYRMLDATNALLAPSALANIFNPTAINNVSQAVAVGDEFSEQVRARYLDFSAGQVRMNIEVLSNNLAASNGLDTETVGGVLYLTSNGVRKTTAMPGEVKAKAALKAIENINTINRASRKILGLPDERPESFAIPTGGRSSVDEINQFLDGITTGGAGVAETQGGAGQDQLIDTSIAPTDLIASFEGFREGAYWDVNAFRTGFGSDTVTRADGTIETVTEDTKVTREDARRDLARRTQEFMNAARRKVGQETWDNLPGNVTAALTSIAYNYGSIPDRLMDSIRSGDTEAIAQAVEGLGDDNEGINRGRRNREAAIIRGEATAPRPAISEFSPRPQLRPDVDVSLPEPEAIQVSDTATSQQLEIIENGIREDGGATPQETPQASPEAAQQAAQAQWDALQTQTKLMLMRVLGGTEEEVIRMIQNGELDLGDLADE